MKKPTVVVALGGNALLRRGEPLEADIQRKNIATAAKTIALIAQEYNVVLVHATAHKSVCWPCKTVPTPRYPPIRWMCWVPSPRA
ncbi:hypothetical protein KAM330_02140 [Aeromonas hydrophila]|nr:hypothetical protein KAM330_02140 [Aeromonas hydrophila]